MAYNTVTVTTSPTLIVPANNKRRQLIMDNQGSVAVYIGPDEFITASPPNTIRLGQDAKLTRDDRWYRGAIYGVVASGTASVAYWEAIE